jgi:hypothetical protein
MADKNWLKQIVETAVSQVLENHLPRIREDIAQQVLEQLEPQLSAAAAAPASSTDNAPADLLKAISAIHAGTTQKEILRGLLDNTVRYSGRAALFVVKAGTATGWEGRGFANNDAIKNFALDVSSGVPARALQSRMTFTGTATDMDPQFVAQTGAASDDRIIVLPLLLKDKVAALIYADAGTAGGTTDDAALEVLVTSTSAWLEVASLRKQSQKEGGSEPAERAEAAPPVQSVSSFSDPFAGHAPMHTAKAVPVTVEPPVIPSAPEAEPEPVSASAAAAAPATAKDAFSHLSQEDADTHRKAQRFARLLVDEIKLYNQAKVADGRKNKDLYDRLKEDIDKSRATYFKRYGNTAAASADYFNSEVVRSLAEDDSSLMGANFRR